MDLTLAWQPHLTWWFIAILGILASAILLIAVQRRAQGAPWRALVLGLVLLALANPVLVKEDRKKLPDVAAVVVDTSASQDIDDRKRTAREAADRIAARMRALDNLDVRVIESGTAGAEGGGTDLFATLNRALGDVPPDRIAGAIFITDGQVHDVPPLGESPIGAPIHMLLTGAPDEGDRKLTIEQAPRFGIVNEQVTLKIRVDDFGTDTPPAQATLTVTIDGGDPLRLSVAPGRTEEVRLPIAHGGENVIELEVNEGPRELTLLNNRAVAVVSGVRDRLRVLLISGEPHAGERTWRNLLKADPAVDLVHFTILRPPEKQDDTPIDELSLIAFPTRELFVDKLDEFDLIIFDRYRRRAILLPAYYSNIARYVENGGALLVASGEDYASTLSIYRTALGAVLPGRPSGQTVDGGYKPLISPDGAKHPVTAGLPGANKDGKPPSWGRWFRIAEAERISGRTLMSGPSDLPLLILDRVGDGRVALMLSDHAWLWTRGVEGGGPQAELLRRLAHWLMKEPDLEEELLRGRVENGQLRIERQTMEDSLPPLSLTTPSGKTQAIALTQYAPGRFKTELPAEEPGLYRLKQGQLSAVAASGSLNAREFSDVRATDAILKPTAAASGGQIQWLRDVPDPQIRLVDPGRDTGGSGWLGLRDNGRYIVTAVSEMALLSPWLALVLILGALLWAWRVEGR
ncbi:MAG: hypothetical protein HXY22_03695 [Alphaproteobacteria bacterium]|nr:hypothetical protein [Alphaproteobacteria bacterium]